MSATEHNKTAEIGNEMMSDLLAYVAAEQARREAMRHDPIVDDGGWDEPVTAEIPQETMEQVKAHALAEMARRAAELAEKEAALAAGKAVRS